MPILRRIGRADLERVLRRWQDGELKTVEVQAFAEDLYCADDVELDDWEHDGEIRVSVAHTTLAVLETLAVNLVTVDDVPALLDFLATRRGYYHVRERLLRRKLDEADFEQRRRDLCKVRPYSHFITPPGDEP